MPPTVNCQPSTVNRPAALPYHSTASVWLSVDPLSDKYPGVSPYVYCAGNPVRLVDVDGREIVNPYSAKVADTKNVISRLRQMIQEGDCDVGLARAALRTQRSELRALQKLNKLVEFAIVALKEDPEFYNTLNNLKDENGNIVDVHIRINNNLPETRHGQCVEEGLFINSKFVGFMWGKVDIELSGRDIGENVYHEGGHLEHDIPNFTEKCRWEKAHGCDYPGYDGHLKDENEETIDPSGIRAEDRGRQYKSVHP